MRVGDTVDIYGTLVPEKELEGTARLVKHHRDDDIYRDDDCWPYVLERWTVNFRDTHNSPDVKRWIMKAKQ